MYEKDNHLKIVAVVMMVIIAQTNESKAIVALA